MVFESRAEASNNYRGLSAIIGALGLLLNVYMNWASLKAFDWSPLLFCTRRKGVPHCEFEDVIFWWNGTKPTQVIGCEKRPREELRFSSDNPLVLGTLQIVEALKDGKADIALFDGSAR
jgi:hypothetical protein